MSIPGLTVPHETCCVNAVVSGSPCCTHVCKVLTFAVFIITVGVPQSRDAGAADVLAVLQTLLAAADGATPRRAAAAQQLQDAARAAANDVLTASEQETQDSQYRDALIMMALRAAAAVDGFTPQVRNHCVASYLSGAEHPCQP